MLNKCGPDARNPSPTPHGPASGLGRPPTGAHHRRCACLWCYRRDSECGIHLFVCPAPADRKPPDFDARVEQCLKRIFLESIKEPTTPAAIGSFLWTQARRAQALTYLRTLDWPNMSAPTVQATLRFLGDSINLYRSFWHGAAGAKNPILAVDLPPH